MIEIKIIQSYKNFVVLKYKNDYYCYSFGKLIAKNDIVNKSQLETQKNKCHLKQFKDIMKKLEQNNTL